MVGRHNEVIVTAKYKLKLNFHMHLYPWLCWNKELGNKKILLEKCLSGGWSKSQEMSALRRRRPGTEIFLEQIFFVGCFQKLFTVWVSWLEKCMTMSNLSVALSTNLTRIHLAFLIQILHNIFFFIWSSSVWRIFALILHLRKIVTLLFVTFIV